MGYWPGTDDLAVHLGHELSGPTVAARAERALAMAISLVLGATGGQLIEAGTMTAVLTPSGGAVLVLPQRPVTAVSALTVAGDALAASDYRLDARSGALLALGLGHWGYEPVSVTFDYGYAVCPSALESVVLSLAARAVANPTAKQSAAYEGSSFVLRLYPGELSRTEAAIVERFAPPASAATRLVRTDRIFG